MTKKNKSILIVDDFPAMSKIIMSYLQKKINNGKFYIAGNGVDALSICSEKTIDLIITDWNMPKMDGMELLKSIRATAKTQHIPVLMITAETSEARVREAITIGVNGFLVKPFSSEKLCKRVELIFSGKSNFIKKNIITDKAVEVQGHQQRGLGLSHPKILVVDDMPENIDIIVGILKDRYDMHAATNGKKALKLALTQPMPDLILLDIMMPEMDGMELCRQLKNNPMTLDIPVMFLTAISETESAVQGFSLGAVDYITKPVNAELLKARVKNHIELKQTKDSLKNQVDTLMENARLREDVERITQHDIKAPLGFIINQSALLGDSELIDSESRKKIKKIETSAVTIFNMVNISINLYKMETNRYQLTAESVDIMKVLLRVKNEVYQSIPGSTGGAKITLKSKLTYNIKVKGEALLCYSLLTNLLKNAVEASGAGETINIEISKEALVIISIQNQAEIPQEIQNSFFDKYVTSGKKKGTGLGTYSAKLMTDVQNGSIEFITSETEGTILIVKLPEWIEPT